MYVCVNVGWSGRRGILQFLLLGGASTFNLREGFRWYAELVHTRSLTFTDYGVNPTLLRAEGT